MSRILDDVSVNINSEYLLTEEGEEDEEDSSFASISYETVATLTVHNVTRITDFNPDLKEEKKVFYVRSRAQTFSFF